MAQSDNTLGAPTEGLGQTVTFSTNNGGGTPQTTAGQRGMLRTSGGPQGAQISNRAQYIPPKADPTMGLLMKMGEDFLKPHIEAAATQQYVKGMQQAASGNAISDIVADQPWYSKVFGSTSLVDGARVYSSNAVVQNVAIAAESDMATLRTMSPTEMQQWGVEKMQSIKTGDAGTDALAVQGLSKVLPHIYERQTKENLVWHNENLANAFLASGSASGSAYQALSSGMREQRTNPKELLDLPAGGVLTEVDMLQSEVSLVSALGQPTGMPPETYNKLMTKVAAGWLGNKQLATFDVFKRSGMFGKLPVEYRDHLDAVQAKANREVRSNINPALQMELAQLQALVVKPNAAPEDLAKYVAGSKSFNENYRRTTGATEDYISPATNVTSQAHLLASIERDNERARAQYQHVLDKAKTAQDKAAAADELIKNDAMSLSKGSNPKELKTEDRANAFQLLYGQGDSTVARPVWVDAVSKAWNYEVVDSAAQGRISSDMRQAASSPTAFARMYQNTYLPLMQAGGDKLALSYFGNDPEHAAQMATFHAAMAGQEVNAETIGIAHARALAPRVLTLSTNKDGEYTPESSRFFDAAQKAVTGMTEATAGTSWYSSTGKAKTPVIADFAGQLAYIAKKLPDSVPPDQRAEYAVNLLKSRGTRLVGGFIVTASGGAPDFVDMLRSYKAPANAKGEALRLVTSGEEHEAVASAVKHFSDATGMEDVQVIQAAGKRDDGDASLLLMGHVTIKGVTQMRYFPIPAKLIADRWAAKEEFTKDHPFYRGGGAPYTPGITDAALSAAYRKYQAQQTK